MWWPAVFDVAVVVLFVVIGRDAHEEANAFVDIVDTAAPFLIGAAAGWAAPITRRMPWSLAAGSVVGGAALVIGMVLRNVLFGDGTAATFIGVAALFLVGGIVGWRLVARRWRPSLVDVRAPSDRPL